MPISKVTGNVQKSTPSSSSGGGERSTFRPPWVKADPKEGLTKVNKPSSTAAAAAPEKSSTTTKPTPSWMKNAGASAKKEPAPPQKEVKLQSREIKVPVMTTKPKPVQHVLQKPVPKKEPTPPSSSEEEEEEETEEEETEDEEDSEDDEINELIQKMKEEKEKVRPVPVAVRKDKSQSGFKFDKPVLKKVTKTFDPLPKKEDDKPQITAVLRKTPKYDEKANKKDEEKPEFKNKVLKKVEPIKRQSSIKSGELFKLLVFFGYVSLRRNLFRIHFIYIFEVKIINLDYQGHGSKKFILFFFFLNDELLLILDVFRLSYF